jgi:hypothetical protein
MLGLSKVNIKKTNKQVKSISKSKVEDYFSEMIFSCFRASWMFL